MEIKVINKLPAKLNYNNIYWGLGKLDKTDNKILPEFLQQTLNNFKNLNYFNKDNNLETIKLPILGKQVLYLSNIDATVNISKASDWCEKQFKFDENITSVLINLDFVLNIFENNDKTQCVKLIIKSLVNNIYQFNHYKSKAKKLLLKDLVLYSRQLEIRKVVEESYQIYKATHIYKDLSNFPPNICNPKFVVDYCKKLFKSDSKVKLKILNEKDMSSLDMNSLLAVARGSVNEPYLINIEYRNNPKKDAKTYALVGKGITFDTGGISLKPSSKMDEMKFDMCGSATVVAVLNAVSRLNLPINVVGTIVLAENMPGGNAYRPGDILTTMSGKTVEVLNTDAEGRLILCDALTYVQNHYKTQTIIDIATLTGACVVALGHHRYAVYSNNKKLANEIVACGVEEYDEGWHMPIDEIYHKQLDSKVADFANIGGMPAGSITAACFLEKFIEPKQNWAHLDIAGVAWDSTKTPSGRPVPSLIRYLIKQVKN